MLRMGPRLLRSRALLGGVLCMLALRTTAATVAIDALTWTELRARVAAGATTALVPIGGTEQSGPHMALGKHNVRARVLSEEIAQKLGNALVAPVVNYVPEGSINPPTQHMRFPGTISVPVAAFESVLEGAAKSLKAAGFREVIFLGDHGGYQVSEQKVAQRLNKEWAGDPRCRAHALSEYYEATQKQYVQALQKRGHKANEIGTHAGLADTSLMLAVEPNLVRAELMAQAPSKEQGTYGDPRASSAELGRIGVREIVESSVAAIRALQKQAR